MIQRPNAFGLWLCEDVLVEEHSKSITLIRAFDRLRVRAFPSRPVDFIAYAVLTDGLGPMTLTLGVSHADTLDEIYYRRAPLTLTDPLATTRIRFRVRSCSFPTPGRYEISRRADEELITYCLVNVSL
jgi:hypothetical protein